MARSTLTPDQERRNAYAAANMLPLPFDDNRPVNILDLPRSEFMAMLPEIQQSGGDVDMMLREYNRRNSIFAPIMDAADRSSQEMTEAGRRPVAGTMGLLSRNIEGDLGLRPEPMAALTGLLGGGFGALDQTLNATVGRVPAADVDAAALTGAGLAMGGGGLLSRPAGSIGMGGRVAPLSSELDPFGYQATRLRDYLSNTDVQSIETPTLNRIPRSWEETEGMMVLPFYGDRSAGDRSILGVNDNTFSAPVVAEGGVDFMRGAASQSDNAIWASNSNITKRLLDTARRATGGDPDQRILGVTGSMAPNANDFATFTGETIAEMMPFAKVSASNAKKFDETMTAQDPSFPGVFSDRLREWAGTATSPMRKTFIRLMESKPAQDAGFPSPGVGRYAVTDPTQRDMPAGMFGLGAGDIDVSAERLFNEPRGNEYRAQVPHSTYNTQITGDYFGSLPPIPQGLLFRDLYDRMEGQVTKAGQPLTEAHRTHAIKTIVPVQQMTPSVIDGILGYLARNSQ
jgi:hypothetical protein